MFLISSWKFRVQQIPSYLCPCFLLEMITTLKLDRAMRETKKKKADGIGIWLRMTHANPFCQFDIILWLKWIYFLVCIFHKALFWLDPWLSEGKITPQRNVCTQPLSSSIHWHSAMVPDLIWKQVASGRVSKFESLIRVMKMEITECECPDPNGT